MRSPRLLPLLVILVTAACADSGQPRTLAVNVHGSVSVTPTSFSGYYVYEDQAGEKVQRTLNGSGNFNEVFSGRRIVRVALRRTSADGLIGLVVTSNGSVVYNSGMLQTDELIFYEADG